MKTKQEVEKMRDDIQIKIAEYDDRIGKAKDNTEYFNLRHIKIQYMAQYNILLEVLK